MLIAIQSKNIIFFPQDILDIKKILEYSSK